VIRRISVVAALLSDAGRVLVQRRPPGKARADLWEFPGGKLEPGESAEDALARECREELGVEVEVGAELWAADHRYEDLEVHVALHRCRVLAGTPRGLETQELRWVAPAELTELPFVGADAPLLPLLAAGTIPL
jgi:8-oxo-dGTP diphosphatase